MVRDTPDAPLRRDSTAEVAEGYGLIQCHNLI